MTYRYIVVNDYSVIAMGEVTNLDDAESIINIYIPYYDRHDSYLADNAYIDPKDPKRLCIAFTWKQGSPEFNDVFQYRLGDSFDF